MSVFGCDIKLILFMHEYDICVITLYMHLKPQLAEYLLDWPCYFFLNDRQQLV